MPGVPKRPDGANYYPEDMTSEEFDSFVASLPTAEQREQAKGFYTVIQRTKDGLQVIPFSEVYKHLLTPLAAHINAAADELEKVALVKRDTTENKSKTSIAEFLRSRAAAFVSNDYLPSEENWLRLGTFNNLEITLGPYETYADVGYSLKASFETYIHVRDQHASGLLEKFSDLQYAEDHLPVPEQYKNKELIAAPIVVVNQLYAGGDVAVSSLDQGTERKDSIGNKVPTLFSVGSNDRGV